MSSADYYLLALSFVLFSISVLCALAETSFVKVNKIHVKTMVDEGKKNAVRLQEMVEKPEATLNVVLLVVLISQLGTASIISIIVEGIGGVGAVVGSILAEIIVFFVLGEVMPKTFAVQNSNKVVLKLTPFLWLLTRRTSHRK